MSAPRFAEQTLPFGPEDLRRLAVQDPERFPVLLDSAATGPLGRYTMLGCLPRYALWLESDGSLRLEGQQLPTAPLDLSGGFLQNLERLWAQERLEAPAAGGHADWPFGGGWLVYLGYEIAAEVETKLVLPGPDADAVGQGPAAFALRVPAVMLYDHVRQQGQLLVEPGQEAMRQELEQSLRAVQRRQSTDRAGVPESGGLPGLGIHEEDPTRFAQAVDRALEHIRAGDIYQANLSRRWRGLWDAVPTPWALHERATHLYERLRQQNPAPFAAFAAFRDWRLLSSSPERLVRVSGRQVETRPIAGTRPRSRRPDADGAEIAALISHPKERAEHIMLVDLERNDLGRICLPGSVRADELMCTESYAHVHHIVSNVSGQLNKGLSPIDVLRAVFPGGSITGCPKFRCMQIIASLEATARGAYTGALGYLNRDGSMDFNILIRTITMDPSGLVFRAGAGIVADSDRDLELQETRAKARGLIAALEACGVR